MLLSAIVATLAAAAAQSDGPAITVRGYAWAPFISPMGEPFRAKSTSDNTLALWFYQADRNRDGLLTPDEMRGDADRFFAILDLNQDNEIDPDELSHYEWEVAPEIQVNSKWRRARGDPAPPAKNEAVPHGKHDEWANVGWHGGGGNDLLEGAARYALLNMPQPVAAADADFNRGISLAEFRQAAIDRFNLLDSKRNGALSLADLAALVPVRPSKPPRAKPKKNAPDTRVGNSLPTGG